MSTRVTKVRRNLHDIHSIVCHWLCPCRLRLRLRLRVRVRVDRYSRQYYTFIKEKVGICAGMKPNQTRINQNIVAPFGSNINSCQ